MAGNFMAGDFLAHTVTFGDFVAGNFLARDFLGGNLLFHMLYGLCNRNKILDLACYQTELDICNRDRILLDFYRSSFIKVSN